jgi:phage regulator Rha-like protein
MSAELVFLADDGEPFTTSLVIADETGNEHASVMRLIRTHLDDLSEIGLVRFEIRPRLQGQHGGADTEYAILDEPSAALLITNLRGNAVVFDFRKRLVAGFYAMRAALTQPQIDLSDPIAAIEAANTRSQQAIEIAKSERAARIEAESRAAELIVPASAYQQLIDAAGDYAVDDAAKVLNRDPAIKTGERKLFQFMSVLGWVFKRDGRWKAYQTQINNGRLAEKPGRPFWHEGRGEMVNAEPTVRITPKGLSELHRRLGGSGQLALVAAS